MLLVVGGGKEINLYVYFAADLIHPGWQSSFYPSSCFTFTFRFDSPFPALQCSV